MHQHQQRFAVFSKTNVAVIDGALATELEARGYSLDPKLWSAIALLEFPEAICQLHRDYLEAGADVLITASYQAAIPGLRDFGITTDAQCEELLRKTVELAKDARSQFYAHHQDQLRSIVIAGSIGPYGAYLADGSEYRGDYIVPMNDLKDFHRGRMKALLAAGCDVLACETMPSFREVEALLELLQEFPEAAAWFSFTLKDSLHISDGTALSLVLETLHESNQVVAVGVNCVPPRLVRDALTHLAAGTMLPLLVYPNTGERWDAEQRAWVDHPGVSAFGDDTIREWIKAGANMIGGCCRTNPDTVREIRRLVTASSLT